MPLPLVAIPASAGIRYGLASAAELALPYLARYVGPKVISQFPQKVASSALPNGLKRMQNNLLTKTGIVDGLAEIADVIDPQEKGLMDILLERTNSNLQNRNVYNLQLGGR